MGQATPIKILHYCWFGGKPMPDEVNVYMDSWRKFLPDFEIMRWDESNFDVGSVPFVKDAYQGEKWAFVSDYVRCYALYRFGGLYLDTDVEMIKGIDDLLGSSFMGFEHPGIVNPGLILYAAQPEMKFYEELLQRYGALNFEKSAMGKLASPILFTDLLREHGLKRKNMLQKVQDITIYPMEYFNPIGDDIASKPKITENTRAIHWYQASWYDPLDSKLFQYRKKHGHFWGTLRFTLRHPKAAWKRNKNKKTQEKY